MNEEFEMNEFWTEEFAPKTIDEMVLTEDIKNHFRNLLESKTRFNLLLAGSPGIGKTTIANIISNTLNATTLFVKCGIEGNVETAKTKLQNFCNAMSIDGRPKVVILDELDSASGTQDNSFQKILRNIISDSPDTIFIGTCNYPEKVISPIKSRLGLISLKFTARELLSRIQHILDTKKIKYTTDSLNDFVINVIKTNYPDIRRIISILSDCCSSGELIVSSKVTDNDHNKDLVKAIVDKAINTEDILEVRKFYIQSKNKIDDYLRLSSEIFNYVIDNGIIKDRAKILRLSNIIYQLNIVVDKEIQFFNLISTLGMK